MKLPIFPGTFYFIFSILFFFILFPASAQRNFLRVDGNVKEEKEKLGGVSITVYKDQQFFTKTVTEDNGKFRFQLNYDTDYLLEFSKPGYVSKRVTVNTNDVLFENQDFGHEYGGWEVSLFRMVNGMDISMFEKPFVKIFYNTDLNKFEHDVEYTNLVKEEFEQLQKDFSKRKKEDEKKKQADDKAAEKALAKAALEKKTDEENKRKADSELTAKNQKEEKEARIAQVKIEEEERKKTRLAEVKINEDARDKIALASTQPEEEYQKIISQADRAFNNKEYDPAKNFYQKAQLIKPKEKYPLKKINEIDSARNSTSISANIVRRDTGEFKTKEEFLQALAKLYPAGMTEETYFEGNVKITRRIVIDGNTGAEYKQTEHPWGGRFWFKNGTPVNELLWNTETQGKN